MDSGRALEHEVPEAVAAHADLLVATEQIATGGEDIGGEKAEEELRLIGGEGVGLGVGLMDGPALVVGLRAWG